MRKAECRWMEPAISDYVRRGQSSRFSESKSDSPFTTHEHEVEDQLRI